MRFSFCMPGAETVLHEDKKSDRYFAHYYEKCLEITRDLGLEVFESNIGTLKMLSDADIDYLSKKYPRSALGLYAFNGLLPAMPNIVTATREETEIIYAHIEQTVLRLEKLGSKILVFGSGGNRRIPGGFDSEVAKNKIYDFIVYTEERCRKAGITLVLEPLNRDETNWCNTVADGAKTVRELALPSFRLLADGYHMSKEKEDLSVIEENADILCHCHIASEQRRIPGYSEYEGRFLSALKKANYKGTVSVECGYSDFFTEAPRAIEFMNKAVK